jgi:hypothetical protein
MSRYIIVLDRHGDDDTVADGRTPIEQVVRELQEAMDDTGVPAGEFRVVAREEEPEGFILSMTAQDALSAALHVMRAKDELNRVLSEQVEIARELQIAVAGISAGESAEHIVDAAARLAELVLALDVKDELKSRVVVALKAYADHLSDEAEAHDKHGDDELGVEADTASDDVWALIRELEGEDEELQSPEQFTVVATYHEPVQIFCTSVEARDADEAVRLAWEECADSNRWDMETTAMSDEWDDLIVLKGASHLPTFSRPPDEPHEREPDGCHVRPLGRDVARRSPHGHLARGVQRRREPERGRVHSAVWRLERPDGHVDHRT